MVDSRAIGYICPFAGSMATVTNALYTLVRWLYNTYDLIKIFVDNFFYIHFLSI
jgi:hypothetical protein